MVGPPNGSVTSGRRGSGLLGFRMRSNSGVIMSATRPSARPTRTSAAIPAASRARYGRTYRSRRRTSCTVSRKATRLPRLIDLPKTAHSYEPGAGVAVLRPSRHFPVQVAMHGLHSIAARSQRAANGIGHHHRAVAAAGATQGDRSGSSCPRECSEGSGRPANFRCAAEIASSAGTSGCSAPPWDLFRRTCAGRGTKCGLGRKRTSKTRSASTGTP